MSLAVRVAYSDTLALSENAYICIIEEELILVDDDATFSIRLPLGWQYGEIYSWNNTPDPEPARPYKGEGHWFTILRK